MEKIKHSERSKIEKVALKNKFLKTTIVGAMACFMGLITILSGCAPMQANTNVESGSLVGGSNVGVVHTAPSPLGLDPENDPVIYTTESGLEIKFGGIDIEASLASGTLSGYPYFTMGTYNGYAVNWVIIGRNPSDTILSDKINTFLFSAWKSGNQYNVGSVQTKAYYFFNNIFETNSPAGAAINAVTPSKSYVADISVNTKPVANSEVSQGTVLALSEYCLGTSKYSQNSTWWEECDLFNAMNDLYNSGLGLTTTQKGLVVKQTLKTRHWDPGTNKAAVTSSTENYFWGLTNNQNSENLQNFYIETYLTTNVLRVGCTYRTTTKINWWTRMLGYTGSQYNATDNSYLAFYIGTDGTCTYTQRYNVYGVRPACIVKFT